MKILIEGENCENYYAKVHESYRTGLRAMCDTRCYGKGYEGYDETIKTFVEIKKKIFGEEDIDLILLTDCWNLRNLKQGLNYTGLENLNCKKAIMLCDFWSEANCQIEEYVEFINQHNIDFILSYFRAPLYLWKNLEIHKKLIWFPPSFDPKLFNDWGLTKKWDVGNLNADIQKRTTFYPERYEMHERLKKMEGISYLTARHPGTGILPRNTPLIGKNFSEAINQCRMFFTSGNMQYRNFAPKYVEIMASHSCLMAYEPLDAEYIGLVDGENYINLDNKNIEETIRYYLSHEQECDSIAAKGYQFVMNKYNCYVGAANLICEIQNMI